MSQLDQLIGYLEREGVSELVLCVGRPIAMRNAKGFTNITARPMTGEQLTSILRGTPLAALIPEHDVTQADPVEVQVGIRRIRVQIGRRGEEIVVRLTRAEAPETHRPPMTQHNAVAPMPRAASPSPREQIGGIQDPEVRFRSKSAEDPRAPTPSSVPDSRPRSLSNAPAGSSTGSSNAPFGLSTGSSNAPLGADPRPRSPSSAPFGADPRPRSPSSSPLGSQHGSQLGPSNAPFGSSNVPSPLGSDARPRSPSSAPSSLGSDPRPRSPSSGPLASQTLPLQTAAARPPRPLATGSGTTLADGVVDDRDAIDLGPLNDAIELELELETVPRKAAPPAAVGLAAAGPAPAPPPGVRKRVGFDGTFGSLVRGARELNASDLHVAAGRVTAMRVGGELVPYDDGAKPLTAGEVEALLAPLLDASQRAQLDKLGYVDFALAAPDGGRLRANVCRQQQGLKGTFRLAVPSPWSLEKLGLPEDLAKVVAHHQGLVVIAGPSGHGKTTTLAALVDLVNSTRPYHILTIEDPVEIIHGRKQAVITQREAGRHTASFARGLKASLREDPDVIVIGELRDRESVEIALTAAETGHLVLATMSTPSAAKTIDRLVDMFPPEEHNQVRASVAGALRAIVAQRLLPKKGGGVVPAIELVTGVLPLAVLIREDKLYQLPNLMQRGRAFGMIRFDESLLELVRSGKIDEDLALANAESRKDLAATLQAKTAQMWKAPPR